MLAFLYDPGDFMPQSAADFTTSSWLLSWRDGPWHVDDLYPGGTVYLVSVDRQEIVWRTRVTHSVVVPYEAAGDLRREISRRWGLDADVTKMVPGGFCVGWRATPIARLDRRVVARDEPCSDHLSQTGWQFSNDLSDEFRRRWHLPDDPVASCSGRTHMGWFSSPDTVGQNSAL